MGREYHGIIAIRTNCLWLETVAGHEVWCNIVNVWVGGCLKSCFYNVQKLLDVARDLRDTCKNCVEDGAITLDRVQKLMRSFKRLRGCRVNYGFHSAFRCGIELECARQVPKICLSKCGGFPNLQVGFCKYLKERLVRVM